MYLFEIYWYSIIIFDIKDISPCLLSWKTLYSHKTAVNEICVRKNPDDEGRGSLKALDTHRFSMFRAWRIAIIQNETHCLFWGGLSPLFWTAILLSSKWTSARIVTSMRMTNKNALSYPANKVILWSYDCTIDGRHLPVSRSDTNRSFDEETRAICRVHEVCRNFIRQTWMLFFSLPSL